MFRAVYISLTRLEDKTSPYLLISLWDGSPGTHKGPLLEIECPGFGEAWPFHETGLNEEVIGILSAVRSSLIRHAWREHRLSSPAPDEPTITVRRREPV